MNWFPLSCFLKGFLERNNKRQKQCENYFFPVGMFKYSYQIVQKLILRMNSQFGYQLLLQWQWLQLMHYSYQNCNFQNCSIDNNASNLQSTVCKIEQNICPQFPRIDSTYFIKPSHPSLQENIKQQEKQEKYIKNMINAHEHVEVNQEKVIKNSKPLKKKKHRKWTNKRTQNKPYAHKNTESNIINQVFSFISNAKKSQKHILKLFGGDLGKARAYYECMNMLKKQNKKYINRGLLVQLSKLQQENIKYKVVTKSKKRAEILSVQQLRDAIRKMIMYYLNHECVISVLTSGKLNKMFKKQNLKRRRQAIERMIEGLTQFQTQKSRKQHLERRNKENKDQQDIIVPLQACVKLEQINV